MKCSVYRGSGVAWDEFVSRHPAGTFFHLSAWRDVLKSSFGYEPIYLSVEKRDQIYGVLPLFLVRSRLFGKSLVAMPSAVYGGPIAIEEEAGRQLVETAIALAAEHSVRYLEIRGNPYEERQPMAGLNGAAPHWSPKDLYVTFLGQIAPDDEANLARIPRKQRRMVRQGEKHGLTARFDNDKLEDFYHVYAESVRNLGTPVYGLTYFKRLLDTFEEKCKLLLIEHGGKTIAGVLSFFYRDQVLPYYGGALKDYLHFAPNDFMYWQLMRYAAAQGYKVFDFGRSKEGTGAYHFKRHWGFEPTALTYWQYSTNGNGVPDTSPLNPRLQWAIRIWRRMPLSVTKLIGPHIVKHIP